MERNRFFVGERVLVSRQQDGENHEEATVVDAYILLIEGDSIPSVVVDFDDGERRYLTAEEPNVLRLPEEEPPLEDDEPEPEAVRGEDESAAADA
jgi:hypothetical protein